MKFIKILSLNRVKRIVIFCLMSIVALSAIILGSFFYTVPKTVLGSEYQTSAQYVFKVQDNKAEKSNLNDLANDVSNKIKARIDNDLNLGVQVQAEVTVDNEAAVRITYPNVKDASQMSEIQNLITYRPNLVATDYYSNPLFDSEGKFNTAIGLKTTEDPGKTIKPVDQIDWDRDTRLPLKPEGTSSSYQVNPNLSLTFNNDEAVKQWSQVSSYLSNLGEDKGVVVFWLRLNEFIQIAKTNFSEQWANADNNPYFFAFVTEKPVDADTKKTNLLKLNQIKASDYLISNSLKSDKGKPIQAFDNKISFEHSSVINGNPISKSQLQVIANQINYGSSAYELTSFSTFFNPAIFSNVGFNYFLIAILIIFVLLALFFVFNYGVLGAIAALSLILLGFLIWTAFNLIGGVFSPFVVAGLIFMFGFFIDKTLVLFDRFKEYVLRGDVPQKAINIAKQKSQPFIFDAHNLALILGTVLFYFGAQVIWGFSTILLIGILSSLFVTVLFSQVLSTLIINTNLFNNRLIMLGILPKKVQTFNSTIPKPVFSFTSKSKVVWLSLFTLFGLAILMLIIFLSTKQTFTAIFNFSQSFSGGSIIEIRNTGQTSLNNTQFTQIANDLISNGVKRKEIIAFADPLNADLISLVRVSVNRNLDLSAINLSLATFDSYIGTVLHNQGNGLIIASLITIGLALLFIVFYTIFRLGWTYSLILLITSLLNLLTVLSFFIIFRLSFNFELIVALFVGLIYSLNNHLMLFSQIKTRANLRSGELDKMQNSLIANQSASSTVKRILLSALTMIILFIVVGSLANIISISLTIALIFSIVITTVSSLFLAPAIWTRIETRRQIWIKARLDAKYWDVNNPEEQTLNGINNFNV